MKIEEYISFRYKGEEPDDELQYVTEHERYYYKTEPNALRVELWRYYYRDFFCGEKLSSKFRFLNFHENAYSDDKRDFVYFVKQSPYLIPEEVLDMYFRAYLENQLVALVDEWLEDRKPKSELGGTDGIFRNRVKLKRLSLEETKNYFITRLTAISEITGKQIMTEEQIMHLLHSNIEGFDPPVPVKELKIKGDFKEVLGTVYDFYKQECTPLHPVEQYCRMAWDNFNGSTVFKSYESCKSNFSKHGKL